MYILPSGGELLVNGSSGLPPLTPIDKVISPTTFAGQVVDSLDQSPIPSATVEILSNGKTIDSTITDPNGNFQLNLSVAPVAPYINISSASYKPYLSPASPYQNIFELERNVQAGEPVVVHSTIQKNNSWLLLLLLIPLLAKKKAVSTVGKIDTPTVIALAAGAVAILGFDTIKKIFEGIGFWNSPDTKTLDAESANPGSPWSPNFWKGGPSGTQLLTEDGMQMLFKQLDNSFGWFDDEEAGAQGVFKQMKTQSQVSFFADWFQKNKGVDLLTWLRGSAWPHDRLSDAEVNTINQFVLNLPKYTA